MPLLTELIPAKSPLSINDYRTLQTEAANAAAQKAFDTLLKATLIDRLKKLNFVFTDDETFTAFCVARLSLIPIADSQTTIICLDANLPTSYGTKLAEFYGNGYSLQIADITFAVEKIN